MPEQKKKKKAGNLLKAPRIYIYIWLSMIDIFVYNFFL